MTKLLFASVALAATVSTIPLLAQEKPDYVQSHRIPDAKVSIEPEGVLVAAPREHPGARMEITGPYEWRHTEILKSGQTAKIGLTGMKEAPLPDGLYRYTITPVAKTDQKLRAELRKARENGDNGRVVELNQKLERAEPQYGTFRILNGRFVDPAVEESSNDRDQGWQVAPSESSTSLREKIYVAESAYRGPRYLASVADAPDPYISQLSRARIGLQPDQVIADDLIVIGSLCVGFDCVNGESFGFTTIRMKENNLRLDYDDTSVAAAFPRNDWRLEANASANGGSSHFAVHDLTASRQVFTIEAGAPSHSFFLDDRGQLGLGTQNPVVEIHTSAGDTPTLRLDQNGSSGWAPQVWDVAGNETNFFVRDATNASQLPFRIRPGAPTSSIDVQSDGAVLFGPGASARATVSAAGHLRAAGGTEAEPGIAFQGEPGNGLFMPEADRIELSVEGNRILRFHSTGLKLINGSPSQPSYAFLNAGNSGFYRAGPGQVGFAADGSEMMRLTTTGLGIGVTSPSEPLEVSGNALAGAHTTPSDVRLKTNVREIENATDLVRQLRGVRFEWNDSGRNGDRAGSPDVGFIAQEVLNVIPEIVSGSDEDYYSVDYSRLVPILLEAIKEQQRRIEVLEARIGS